MVEIPLFVLEKKADYKKKFVFLVWKEEKEMRTNQKLKEILKKTKKDLLKANKRNNINNISYYNSCVINTCRSNYKYSIWR